MCIYVIRIVSYQNNRDNHLEEFTRRHWELTKLFLALWV